MDNVLTIFCIKTNKGCFISDCLTPDRYYTGQICNLFFDGKKPEATYQPGWFYLEKFPTTVQCKKAGEITNRHYELKDESFESEKLPKIIPYEEENNYDKAVLESLYVFKWDQAPAYFEDVEYDLQVICEVDNYSFPPNFEYKAIEKSGWSDRKYIIKNADINHQLLDKIMFPAVFLHERPCKLTSKQMYDITRQYILEHIDNAAAKVTSNFSFCFEVKKLIPMIEPETITYQNIFGRTKRERNKIRTTIKKYDEKTIFEMTSDQDRYAGYSTIPEMLANSETELKEKVDTWLEGLIKIINEPLCQCPHCLGTGYISKIEKVEFDYNKTEK